MTNSTSTTGIQSTISAIWSDIRHGQRRLIEHNRVAKRTSR